MAREQLLNTPTPLSPSTPWTTLSAAIVDGAVTSITVVSAAAFTGAIGFQFRVMIDSEILLVTAGINTTTWTVTRGLEGSTAAAHAIGAGVFGPPTAGGVLNIAPGLTTAGGMAYLSSTGAPAQLAPPSDGDYLTRWTSAVPSWVTPVTVGLLTAASAAATYQPIGSYATLTGSETLTNKTLTTPTIASFANATHTHLNAAGGGVLSAAAVSAAGSDTQVQFNNAGALGGSADLTLTAAGLTNLRHSAIGAQSALNQVFDSGYTGSNLVSLRETVVSMAGLSQFKGVQAWLDIDLSGNAGASSSVAALQNYLRVPSSSTTTITTLGFNNNYGLFNGSGNIATILGVDATFIFNGTSGVVDFVYGLTAYVENNSGQTLQNVYGVKSEIGNWGLGTITNAHGVYVTSPINDGGGTVGVFYAFNAKNLAHASIPLAYYLWNDSRGVYRIQEDNAADGAGNPQAIPALYNPRVTKYTPGAANYERGVQQWVANVYQMGTEGGGTGVQRAVQIIGASLVTPAGLTVGNNLVTLGGALTTSGANALTLTTTGATNVTLPTTGTLATTTQLASYLPLAGGTLTGPITGTSGVIEQYNSTTAQAFRVYNTRTDASNYEYGYIGFASNIWEVGSAALGTGVARSMRLRPASAGHLYLNLGGTDRWAFIGTTGHMVPESNNAYDIGSSGNRVRTLYMDTSIDLVSGNIVTDTTTGLKIGTATTQKIGFYNATPIVQGASIADASGGTVQDAEARTAINALISRIEATGLIATV